MSDQATTPKNANAPLWALVGVAFVLGFGMGYMFQTFMDMRQSPKVNETAPADASTPAEREATEGAERDGAWHRRRQRRGREGRPR